MVRDVVSPLDYTSLSKMFRTLWWLLPHSDGPGITSKAKAYALAANLVKVYDSEKAEKGSFVTSF